MTPPKKTAIRTKRRIVSPVEKRTQIRLTVDSKFTKTHFTQLFAVLKIRNKNALAAHGHRQSQQAGARGALQAAHAAG